MTTALHSLHDVLVDNIKDLYHAEKQLTKALPRMAKMATDPELREAIEEHLEVTEGQVRRLEQVFDELGMDAKAKKCPGMEGLIEEGKEVLEMKKNGNPAAVDAAIIAAAQKVEHYEISGYGSARAFAETLGLERVAELLQETLDEESEANEKLTEIAEQTVNPAAASGEEEESMGVEAEEEVMSAPRRGGRRR